MPTAITAPRRLPGVDITSRYAKSLPHGKPASAMPRRTTRVLTWAITNGTVNIPSAGCQWIDVSSGAGGRGSAAEDEIEDETEDEIDGSSAYGLASSLRTAGSRSASRAMSNALAN